MSDLVSKDPNIGRVCAPGSDGSALWRDPSLTLGERCVIFSREELARDVREHLGANDGHRIREYFKIPFVRRSTGKPIVIQAAEWCAASACFAHSVCALPGEVIPPHRIAGIELELDAKEAGTWIDKSGTPRVGDLAIYKRAGADWARHVTRVTYFDRDADILWTIGGNEADTWREQARKPSDAALLGYIRIGA